MVSANWTPEAVADLLDRNDLAVERAVVALYRRQTEDEKDSQQTKHHNGVGFNAVHAWMGSYYARWVLSGRHLDGRHLERARKMAKRYVGQLARIAQSRFENPPTQEDSEVSHV